MAPVDCYLTTIVDVNKVDKIIATSGSMMHHKHNHPKWQKLNIIGFIAGLLYCSVRCTKECVPYVTAWAPLHPLIHTIPLIQSFSCSQTFRHSFTFSYSVNVSLALFLPHTQTHTAHTDAPAISCYAREACWLSGNQAQALLSPMCCDTAH